MTAKRFTLTNPKNAFQEMKCGIDDRGKTLTFNEAVNELNEQHETIQKLNQQLRIFSDGLKAEIRETKEVFEDYSECLDEKKQLKQENEQLKEKNEQLLLKLKYTCEQINYSEKLREMMK